jgi:hypothetical protein
MLSKYVPPGRVVEEYSALQVPKPDNELDPYYRAVGRKPKRIEVLLLSGGESTCTYNE